MRQIFEAEQGRLRRNDGQDVLATEGRGEVVGTPSRPLSMMQRNKRR